MMKQKSICLISPPKRSNVQIIPIALIYLSAWLEKSGINADIIDIKNNPNGVFDRNEEDRITRKIIERLCIEKPYFVGITCFTSEYNSVMRLARSIRDNVDTKIIVGGVHPTLRPADFIYKDSPVDFAVIGEGEETITELVNRAENADTMKDVKGIAFLEGDNIYLTPPRELIDDLGKLPMPAYDKLDMAYYLKMTKYVIRYMYTSGVHILASRGCPFLCTFCAAKNLWKTPDAKPRVRYKSINQIVDEIQYLSDKYGIDSFYLADDTFAMNKEKTVRFCDELLDRKINIIWARVNLWIITPMLLRLCGL